ncbi:stage II sporulation protein M [Acetivibrio cellulolyticus]|uniref:stage II sporulation protein M n=1 Tax=Acetivibrio cellulolyticus TaxID=35830 RepID=UPI0001E2DEC8|nr:stage II sporulation protein M [Acetivibrio cellulolyticus]
MKEDKFIIQNSEIWKNLELTLTKLKSKSIYSFSKDELDSFFSTYNLTCGHLSYARTNYGNTNTTNYLNKLVASAHSYIYTTKTFSLKKIFMFLLSGFPRLIKKNMKPILLATSLFVLGVAVSFIFTLISTDNAGAFISQEMADSVLNRDVNEYNSARNGAILSPFIFTNNIKVGILAFAFGITLAIGTVWLVYTNGYMLGALAALYFHKGGSLLFWSLILPHGILELFAIFICGGAGLILGYSIINPGKYSRKDSFIIKGKEAIQLVLGTIPIFIIAGLIEGNFTPSALFSEIAKLIFAFITLLLLSIYLIVPNIRHPQVEAKE